MDLNLIAVIGQLFVDVYYKVKLVLWTCVSWECNIGAIFYPEGGQALFKRTTKGK